MDDVQAVAEAQCCNGACRRKSPLHLFRSPLTGTWFVATRWRRHHGDLIEALEKHRLPDDAQAQLSDMADALAWVRGVERQVGPRAEIERRLGIELVKVEDA